MVDRCVICGEPVPEGRQVCPICIERTVGREQDDMDIHTATEEAYKKGYEDGKRDAYEIEKAPAIDVAPVVRGRWLNNLDENGFLCNVWRKCSACGGLNYSKKPPYCPNCGARMDGE